MSSDSYNFSLKWLTKKDWIRTLGTFSFFCTWDVTFVTSCLWLCTSVPFWKEVYCKLFPFRENYISGGRDNDFTVASPKSAFIPLKIAPEDTDSYVWLQWRNSKGHNVSKCTFRPSDQWGLGSASASVSMYRLIWAFAERMRHNVHHFVAQNTSKWLNTENMDTSGAV